MNTSTVNHSKIYLITYLLYLIFLVSLIFSLRALSSISIAAILLTGIVTKLFTRSSSIPNKYRLYFVTGCTVLFLITMVAILYTRDVREGWNSVRIKTGLLITPLAIYLAPVPVTNLLRRLLFHYSLVLAIAALYCIGVAFARYYESGDLMVFFYHSLVAPISQHAIQLSLMVLFGLAYLIETIKRHQFFLKRIFHLCLIIFLSVFLFMLSSKLVISFYLVYLLYIFLQMLKNNKSSRLVYIGFFALGILSVMLIFAIPNPISRRFYDVVKGNISVVRQDRFKPGDYFNGLQFRLLQWRFVPEILSENNCWLMGVSPGDAQSYLNEKYLSKNMYSGDPARGTRGYLVYNTHNQFLQTLLQTGFVGLVVLLITCFFMLKMAIEQKSRLAIFVTLVLLGWLFTESPFETQYGIVIFTFFPMFLASATISRNSKERPGS